MNKKDAAEVIETEKEETFELDEETETFMTKWSKCLSQEQQEKMGQELNLLVVKAIRFGITTGSTTHDSCEQ